MPAVAALDFVEGFLVRVAWKDIEPSPGNYDWSLIDGQIQAASAAGKSVSLAIVNGPQAPAWLATQGAQMFSYDFHDSAEVMPVPWDAVYLDRWAALVRAAGDRYADEGTIGLVYVTNSSANGFEMQIPSTPPDVTNWNAIGYTDERYAGSWEAAIDVFAEAFLNHPLSHEVHPVLGDDAVARVVTAYAHQHYGDRVGTLAAWWMVHNAQDVYPGMYDLLVQSSMVSHAQAQVANSYTVTPERFGPDGIAAELDLAATSGVAYVEVWNSDLLNPALADVLSDANDRLRGGLCSPDLGEPADVLNFFDVAEYVALFSGQSPIADVASPFGVLNFFDMASYIGRYNAGCP